MAWRAIASKNHSTSHNFPELFDGYRATGSQYLLLPIGTELGAEGERVSHPSFLPSETRCGQTRSEFGDEFTRGSVNGRSRHVFSILAGNFKFNNFPMSDYHQTFATSRSNLPEIGLLKDKLISQAMHAHEVLADFATWNMGLLRLSFLTQPEFTM